MTQHNPECGLDCVSAGAVRIRPPADANQSAERQQTTGDRTAGQVKHTPGPWRVHLNFADMVCAGPQSADGIDIADCSKGRRAITERSERVANARLIAAAPEMLEELRSIVEWTRVERCALREQEIEHILSIIAKAEGRQS